MSQQWAGFKTHFKMFETGQQEMRGLIRTIEVHSLTVTGVHNPQAMPSVERAEFS
jgi:hypothetical protein